MFTEKYIINDNNCEISARTIVITMVLAFILPVTIMALALLRIQVWPGGKFTLLIYDLKAQFAPVIASLRYFGKGDSSLFYSFCGALGNNAFLNYISYVLDPIVWMSVFLPLEHLPNVVYFITLIKIGLCGVGAGAYFFFGMKGRRHPLAILLLSTCYALMSYNVMYSQWILMFNVVALTPVILIGIERIIDGEKGMLYVLFMTLSLYYNSQLSFMVGLFSILYLMYRLSEEYGEWKRVIRRFLICNILCAGLYMPVALPVMFNILNGRMQAYNYMSDRFFYYPLWRTIKQFLSCQYTTIESRGLPNLFCGTFIPLLAIFAVILPINSIRTKVMSVSIIVFFMISFCTVPLNQFWHGFNEPNSYPARYSFLLCLFLLILGYQVVSFVYEKTHLPKSTVYLIEGIAMLVTCIEMYLNAGFILTSLNLEMNYLINSEYQFQIRETKAALDSIDDTDFYRVGKDLQLTYNDGMLFGFNGIGYFFSLFERGTMDFIGKLGYSQNEHVLTGIGGTPVSESILGVKYKMLREPKMFGYYEDFNNDGLFNIQYNKYALPLAFLINYGAFAPNSDYEITEGLEKHNALVYQELVLSELLGERIHAYENIDYTIEKMDSDDFARHIKMRFIVTREKPIWIYCKDEHNGNRVTASNRRESTSESDSFGEKRGGAFLTVNGEPRYPFVDNISTMCVYLGTFKLGEEVEVEAACVSEFDDPWIAYYNAEETELALETIRETGVEITEHKNGIIKGRINVRDDDDLVIMTLPAMKGYRVKVDGIRTEYGAYRDALLALKMEPGEHIVEISFVPYGLIPGICLFLLSIFSTGLYFGMFNRKKI